MKLFANLVEITSTKIGQYPGDNSGDSIIATFKGSAGKGETGQVHGQVGIIGNPAKTTKQVRIRIGSLDILISSLNYKVPMPTNPGDTKVYSTDADGAEQAKHYLDDGGIHTFNDGTLESARNTDPVKVTIPIGTFIVSVSGGSGAPAVGVLNATPIDVNGTIQDGTKEVLLP